MKSWSRLLLVFAALTLCSALFGPAAAQQSSVVGLVINEDGDSIAVIDPETGRVTARPTSARP